MPLGSEGDIEGEGEGIPEEQAIAHGEGAASMLLYRVEIAPGVGGLDPELGEPGTLFICFAVGSVPLNFSIGGRGC